MWCLLGLAFCADAPKAIGYGSKATGGAGGTKVTVTTRDALAKALAASGKAIIIVSGVIDYGSATHISEQVNDKTLIGLPGAELKITQQEKEAGGITLKSGSSNVIIRNLIFTGPGAYDIDGNDLLSNQGCTNLWVDHCEFYDGLDGNFDNSKSSDDITISYCKFGYKKPAKAGGSGGSDDHRFSNLIGGSDSDAPSDGHYSITFWYCYWSEGCRERMPRGRNLEVHILNCLWETSASDSLAIGLSAGSHGTGVYVENSNFKKISRVLKADYGGSPSCTFVGCTNGASNVGSSVSKPSYSYTAASASTVETTIKGSCGAGATLKVDSDGNATC